MKPWTRRQHLIHELARLSAIGRVSGARLKDLFLKDTLRGLGGELAALRKLGKGPGFVVGTATNSMTAYYYDYGEVVAFFGGAGALFHRYDEPEMFTIRKGCNSAKPSARFRTHRTNTARRT